MFTLITILLISLLIYGFHKDIFVLFLSPIIILVGMFFGVQMAVLALSLSCIVLFCMMIGKTL